MKNTNIFLEVDDMTYNLVVAPHKKNKTFTKLVTALLRSYMEDQYVRASVEGTLDELKRQSLESLDSAVMGLNQSLSSMGLFTDELSMTAEKGAKFFSKKAKEQSEEVKSMSPITVDQEKEDLRKEIDSLKDNMKEVTRQNADIMEMLRQVVSNSQKGSSPAGLVEEAVVTEEPLVEEKPSPTVIEMPKVKKEEPVEEVQPVPDEGMKKMSAFMMGNFKSF